MAPKTPAPPPRQPLTYAGLDPMERARRQAIMDEILAKHERETVTRQLLKERRAQLETEVEAWHHASRIRTYVAELDALIAQGALPNGEYASWRADALSVADAIDPVWKRLNKAPPKPE